MKPLSLVETADAMASARGPSCKRIQALAQSLSALKAEERSSPRRPSSRDSGLARLQPGDQTRLQSYPSELQWLQHGEGRMGAEMIPSREAMLLEASFEREVDVERRAHRELEEHILREVDARCHEVRLEIAREKKLREEAEERAAGEIAHTHASIAEVLANDRRNRDGRNEQLRQQQEEELQRLREALEREKQMRAQSEADMLHTIEELCTRVRAELALERKQREALEAMVLKVLDSGKSEPRSPWS